MSIAIVYGSNGGVTETVAEMILNELGGEVEMLDVADIDMDKLNEYSHLIIGTSTWGDGELQDDWDGKESDFKNIDLSGKTVAFFGLGDQEGYTDSFVDGMGILHDIAVANGANVVGDNWSTDGYDFEESVALKDGAFVGLAIDEDNQDDLTEDRVKEWVATIKKYF